LGVPEIVFVAVEVFTGEPVDVAVGVPVAVAVTDQVGEEVVVAERT
jgi:hypothetical protein